MSESILYVYIIHWNQPDASAGTVKAFEQQGIPIRITVLDNGSSEENRKRLKSLLADRVNIVWLGRNLGFGPGLNEGLRSWLSKGDGDYVVVSAHDAIPDDGCLSRLLETMTEYPRVGISSAEYGVGHIACFNGWKGPYLIPHPRGQGFEAQAFPHGTIMMFRKRCIEEIGLFEGQYFAYGDEMDIGLRARKYKWEVGVVWGAKVKNPKCSVPSPAASYLQVRNAILLVKKWKGWHWALVRSLFFGVNAFRLLFWRSKRPAMFSFRAWLMAIRDVWLGRYGAPPLSLQANIAGKL